MNINTRWPHRCTLGVHKHPFARSSLTARVFTTHEPAKSPAGVVCRINIYVYVARIVYTELCRYYFTLRGKF